MRVSFPISWSARLPKADMIAAPEVYVVLWNVQVNQDKTCCCILVNICMRLNVEPGEHQGWVVSLEVSWCWGGAHGTQSGWWLTRLSFWGRISNWSEQDTSWWETLMLIRWIRMGKKYNWFQRDAYWKRMTKRFQDKTHHVFGKYVSKPLISLSFSTHSQDEIGPV